ncbi:MAG: transglutaminase family protein [Kofleriaceae bacterium]
MSPDEIFAALAAHDDLIARRSIDIWIGGEPTFTRADSMDPAWTNAAEGDDKLVRALALATELADQLPGASVSRVIGRMYPEEKQPRFAFGVRWRDDGTGDAHRISIETEAAAPPSELGDDRYLSVTPDPGVVEVNMAPSATAAAFYAQAEAVWDAARNVGLHATRPRFNGDLADSGGGGQITLGGARPEMSPFVRYPHLLPALIRYLNNHPSLSYWFASECVGGASQGPRPDEGARERYDELEVTLRWLEELADRGELAPEQLWHALGPLLVDGAGNSHRAELNVEKLWNPHVPVHGPRHGKMGVVELRAIRMPERPSMLAALVALLRSVVARLIVDDYRVPLIDWHDELHDLYALPAALQRDLRYVLGDLDEHGFGLAPQLRVELDAWRDQGITCRLGDAVLSVRPALEFWPLVGDVASQETATSRLVDASTQRWELAFEGPGPEAIAVGGRWAKLRPLADGVRIVGLRRRIYQPSPGFHPGLPAQDPLVIEWAWGGRSQRIELWAWRPAGGAYPGLPTDDGDALARRSERIVIATRDHEEVHADGHHREVRPFTIDLRR